MTDHPNLHLLNIERTGWRRWIFGRWVYSSEPFRHDFARRLADLGGHIECGEHHTSLVYEYRNRGHDSDEKGRTDGT